MSDYNKQIVNNSIFSIIQIFIVTGATFFLYRYIIQVIGLEKLGLWSLILSVTSLANIGNFGFTGSLIKFSAELSIKNEYKKINGILNSSIIGISIISALILSLIFILGHYFIGSFVEQKWIEISITLLKFALISLYVNIIGGLYFSILEGLNMAYLKSLTFIFATLTYVILSIILTNKFDLLGLAYAQVIQAIIFLFLGIVLSKIKIKNFNIFYFKWHKKLMKEVFSYGINFQAIGVAQMLYDPITKALLSRYGSLDYVGIFEIASKVVKQARSLTASILQNIVPKIVNLNTALGGEKIINAYKKINDIKLVLLFSTLLLLIPLSNIISKILLEEDNKVFILVLIGICIGWFLNSLNIAAFMINLGTGNLKWNVISHITIGVLNIILCFFIGFIFQNGIYIIFSWIIALIIGSSIIILEYHKRNNLSFRMIFSKMFYKLLTCFILLILISHSINILISNLTYLIIIQGILIFSYCGFILLGIKEVKEEVIFFILKTKKNS